MAFPHKRILVVCGQINRKHDIPVCFPQEAVNVLCPAPVHRFQTLAGCPEPRSTCFAQEMPIPATRLVSPLRACQGLASTNTQQGRRKRSYLPSLTAQECTQSTALRHLCCECLRVQSPNSVGHYYSEDKVAQATSSSTFRSCL